MKKTFFSTICLSLLCSTLSFGQTASVIPATMYPGNANYSQVSIDNDNKISNGAVLNADAWINTDVIIGTHYLLASGPAYVPINHLAIPASFTAPYLPIQMEGLAVTENGNFMVAIYKCKEPTSGSVKYFRAVLSTVHPFGTNPVDLNLVSLTGINATNFIGLEADDFGNVYYAFMNGSQLNITHSTIGSGLWTNYPALGNYASTIDGEGELSFTSYNGTSNRNIVHVAMANSTGAKVMSFEHIVSGPMNYLASSPTLSLDVNPFYNFWDMIDISAPEFFDHSIPSSISDQYVIAYPHQGRIKTFSPLNGFSTIVSTPTQSSFYGSVELEYQNVCKKGYTLAVFFGNNNNEVSMELDQKGICVSPVYKDVFHGSDQHGRNFSLGGKHSDYLNIGLLHGDAFFKTSKCIATNWKIAQTETEINEDILMYPNPVNNILTIEGENIDFDKEMTISTMLGQVISRMLPSNTLDLSNIPSGNYILKVQTKDGAFKSNKITKL